VDFADKRRRPLQPERADGAVARAWHRSVYLPEDPNKPGQKLQTYWISYYIDGKRKRESSKSRKKSNAQAPLRRRMGEHALGLEIGDEAKRLTFEDLEAGFRRSYENSGRRSLQRAGKAWDHLRDHFGGWKARAITANALEQYVTERLKELPKPAKPATVQYELAVLRLAFNLAVRAGRLQTRPPFPTLRINNRRQGFFEEDDFRAVLAELPEDLKPLMTVGFLTGWRVRDELCPMTWDRVDPKAGTMRLERSKNDNPRVFPINADPELADVFRKQRKYTDEVQHRAGQIIPLVFHKEGRPIVNYYKAWHAACKRAAAGFTTPLSTFYGSTGETCEACRSGNARRGSSSSFQPITRSSRGCSPSKSTGASCLKLPKG
jgi:hypothetical protein